MIEPSGMPAAAAALLLIVDVSCVAVVVLVVFNVCVVVCNSVALPLIPFPFNEFASMI